MKDDWIVQALTVAALVLIGFAMGAFCAEAQDGWLDVPELQLAINCERLTMPFIRNMYDETTVSAIEYAIMSSFTEQALLSWEPVIQFCRDEYPESAPIESVARQWLDAYHNLPADAFLENRVGEPEWMADSSDISDALPAGWRRSRCIAIMELALDGDEYFQAVFDENCRR